MAKDTVPLDQQAYIEEALGCLWIIGGLLAYPIISWVGIVMIIHGAFDHLTAIWIAIKHVKGP